jgi:hypothetical protein
VLSTLHARLRVRQAPGIPHALYLQGERFMHNSGVLRRENAGAYPEHVMASGLAGTISSRQDYFPATGRTIMPRKYSKKASDDVERVMKKRKAGTLKSGRSGRKVTSRKQAIAIGLSEARAAGAKVPRKTSKKKAAKKRKAKK